MRKIALIDFCGTITDFQTLCPYLEYMLSLRNKLLHALICNRIVRFALDIISRFLYRLFRISFSEINVLLWLLKGTEKDIFIKCGEMFYQDRIKPHIIPETMNVLRSLKDSGCMLMIVSGGSGFYISYFAAEFGVDHCLTVEFGFKNGRCTGKIANECMREKKVERIKRYIVSNDLDCSFEACVTDSISDLPILNLCKDKIIISAGEHQKWVTKDMREILYQHP